MSGNEAKVEVVNEATTEPGGMSAKVTILGALLLSIGCSVLGAGGAVYYMQQHAAKEQKILLVDGNALLRAKVAEITTLGVSQDDLPKKAQEFSAKLQSVMNQYRDAGYLVINTNVVLASPDGVNVTADVAKALNVNVVPAANGQGQGNIALPGK